MSPRCWRFPLKGGLTVADALRDKILVIGENLSIRRFVRYEGDCVAYVHGGGRIGVLVRFEADAAASGSDALKECGKDVAMQIAALNATYLNKESVPAADIEKRKEILVAQIKTIPKTRTSRTRSCRKWWMAGSANSMRTTA